MNAEFKEINEYNLLCTKYFNFVTQIIYYRWREEMLK